MADCQFPRETELPRNGLSAQADATSHNEPPLGRQLNSVPRPAQVWRAWWTVGLLSSLYIISYIDRIIPSLLVGPLKAAFNVGDAHIGLLFGAAFAVFYGFLGLPAARLADRGNRKKLILAGVAIWSLCTIGSGLAGTFIALVLLRMGVAIGEAVLSPAAYSMIGSMFTPERRFLPSAIYAASGNVGTYGAYIAGASVLGWAASDGSVFFDRFSVWQVVFFCVGVPGLLIGILFFATTFEPVRDGDETTEASGLSQVTRFFFQHTHLFGGLFLGASLITIVIFAFGAWVPEYLHRSQGWSVEQAGLSYGITGLCCSVIGTLAFSSLAESLTRNGIRDGLVLVASAGAALGCAAAGLAAIQTNGIGALICLGVMVFCLTGCSNLIVISNQFTVPARFRATAIAIMFMCTILIGLGLGPPLVAWLSSISANPADLGPALAIISFAVLVPATALIYVTRKHYATQLERGVVD